MADASKTKSSSDKKYGAATKKTVKKEVKKETTKKTVKKVAEKAVKSEKINKESNDGSIQENTNVKDEANSQAQEVAEPKVTAKAGKRSAKAIAEAEEKQAKEARKAETKDEKAEAKPKVTLKPARSRLERRSKKFREAAKLIDKTKTYELKEALDLAIKTNPVKFDATVELHINLNVDPKQADQNIRGTVVLPAGTGKSARVAVFGEADEVVAGKKAGADIAGGDEFLQQLNKEQIDFDILVASPKVMAKLSKYARLLGPKGLMPNPKSGTVTTDIAKAVKEAKAGRVEYRVDSTGIVHVGVGKVSFGVDKLTDNTTAVLAAIKSAKPASIKGNYIKSSFITTSMGPSIKLSV